MAITSPSSTARPTGSTGRCIVGPHVVRLRPAPHCRTPILVVLAAGRARRATSSTGSRTRSATTWPGSSSRSRRSELTITVDLVADMTVINPFDFFVDEAAEHFPFAYEPQLAARPRAVPRGRAEPGPLLADVARRASRIRRRRASPIVDFLVELNQRACSATSRYTMRMEPGVQTPERDAASTALGSCRDSAWLLVQVLRQLGLAARFVSGYLVQLSADQPPLDGPAGPERRLHRPARVGRGVRPRRGLDRPRPDLRPVRRRGPHPARVHARPGAAPRRSPGVTEPCRGHASSSRNTVRRLHEDPRVTLPYSDDAVGARSTTLGARGRRRACAAGDVRLTHGRRADVRRRSTTWTAPEWTIAADGDGKRDARLDARRAARASASRPAALLQHGQGKWYPGEPLPRWQIGVLLARPTASRCGATRRCSPTRWTPGDRRRSTTPHAAGDRAIAAGLGVPAELLPARVRGPARTSCWPRPGCPAASRPRSTSTRPIPRSPTETPARAIVAALDADARRARRLGAPAAPRRRRRRRLGDDALDAAARRTSSCVPGDSPMGLRLPLDVAHVEAAAARARALDVRAPRRRCPAPTPRAAAAAGGRSPRTPAERRPAHRAVRRAARGPRARVPAAARRTSSTPSSCSRVVEAAADARSAAGRPRGLPAAARPAARCSSSSRPTPASSRSTSTRRRRWPELVDITTDAATTRPARVRLGTEKFHLDGTPHRHRRRQPHHPRRADAGRQPAAAPARPAAQPRHLLAAPPVAVVPVLRPLRRPDQPGAARRRGPPRDASTSSRSRSPSCERLGASTPDAVAGRPAAAPPARRRHRQHAPRRVLHRQAVQPGLRARPARPARAARLRDAAAPADGARAGAARARARRPLLGRALRRAARALGHRAARPVPAALVRRGRHRRRGRRPAPPRLRVRRRRGSRRSSSSASRRIGAVDVAGVTLELRAAIEPWHVLGEEVTRHRHRPLRRLVGRAAPGAGRRAHRGPPRRHLQRRAGPAAAHRRRPATLRRRRALPGLAAAVGAAPDDRRARAARVRPRRPLERPLARRLHLPRRPSRRPGLRPLPGQRQRGRGPPGQPLRAVRPHARAGRRRGPRRGAAVRTSAADEYPRTLDLRRAPCREPTRPPRDAPPA